jgi:hypothetical protein
VLVADRGGGGDLAERAVLLDIGRVAQEFEVVAVLLAAPLAAAAVVVVVDRRVGGCGTSATRLEAERWRCLWSRWSRTSWSPPSGSRWRWSPMRQAGADARLAVAVTSPSCARWLAGRHPRRRLAELRVVAVVADLVVAAERLAVAVVAVAVAVAVVTVRWMSPRQVLPGQFYMVTRRCTQRQFLLRADAATNNAFTYCLIEAAQRCQIDVLLPCALSNHYHAVVFDRLGRYPEFLEHFHKMFVRS